MPPSRLSSFLCIIHSILFAFETARPAFPRSFQRRCASLFDAARAEPFAMRLPNRVESSRVRGIIVDAPPHSAHCLFVEVSVIFCCCSLMKTMASTSTASISYCQPRLSRSVSAKSGRVRKSSKEKRERAKTLEKLRDMVGSDENCTQLEVMQVCVQVESPPPPPSPSSHPIPLYISSACPFLKNL